MTTITEPPGLIGLAIHAVRVPVAWVDYNGHMGDYAYGIVFSDAVTAYMDRIGVDAAYRGASAATIYTLESRIGYLRECHEGAALTVDLLVLAADRKRIHTFMRLLNAEGAELALCEQVLMHVSRASGTPRAALFPPEIQARVDGDMAAHAALPRPAWLSRPMGLARGA
ncbi:thioesterase family protein [Aquabacter sp. P-9]|uniref:thioesterase family protein n=1 Tax=Aquabacter sediminis TaxID=3029197 RepID=UPI00237EB78A|nr:thioesterase family protein [Aquabacter sp. P-9]MDE1570452.1 thioesterase family protein [Aquabacter sp. P-9]